MIHSLIFIVKLFVPSLSALSDVMLSRRILTAAYICCSTMPLSFGSLMLSLDITASFGMPWSVVQSCLSSLDLSRAALLKVEHESRDKSSVYGADKLVVHMPAMIGT